MTPNGASPAAAAVVALALLGSLSPTTSFVPAASRGQQVLRHANTRTSSRFSGPPPPPPHASAPSHSRRQRQPPSCFAPTAAAAAGHQRHRQQQQQQQRAWPPRRVYGGVPTTSPTAAAYTSPRLPALRPLSIGGEGLDGIDPLEEGPDPDAILLQGEPEVLRQKQEKEDYEAELAAAAAALASAKKAPTKKQIAEEAVAAAVAQMGAGEEGSGGAGSDRTMMASLKPKNRKTGRVKIDPLMPKGGVAPNEWAEYRDLEEGCRGVLVVMHTGLPKDKKRATTLIRAVKDRFGHLIHTYEWWDDDPELTEDDREEINNFEVWLEGPTVVHYHERAEGRVDMDDEQMQKVLDDLEIRVVDEVILGQYVNEDLQFLLPGFRVAEQRGKQFPEL